MTHEHATHHRERLLNAPTGVLQSAVVVRPNREIENARPLPGEPGAIIERAREQLDVFRSTLEYFGVQTTVVESSSADPYECCAANAAVVLRDGAFVMRPSAMSRRSEADRMRVELARLDVPLSGHIAAPGLLDGNDVLLAGTTAFVGNGGRGNELGRSGFSEVARHYGYRTVEVALAPGVPALRYVATAVAPDTIVLGGDKADASAFAGFKTIVLERGEEGAAGALCLSERHVISDMRYRTALNQMERAGITVESIDLYEFTKIGVTPSMLALVLKRA
jgi:dimethylargininase